MDTNDPQNGWTEYRALVLSELERLDTSMKNNHDHHTAQLLNVEARLSDKLHNINNHLQATTVEVTALQVKAGLWGALAGLIPTLTVLLLRTL